MALHATNADLMNIDDKIWMYRNLRVQLNAPQPPVLFAEYWNDGNFSFSTLLLFFKNRFKCSTKGHIVLKPSHLNRGLGIVFLNPDGSLERVNHVPRTGKCQVQHDKDSKWLLSLPSGYIFTDEDLIRVATWQMQSTNGWHTRAGLIIEEKRPDNELQIVVGQGNVSPHASVPFVWGHRYHPGGNEIGLLQDANVLTSRPLTESQFTEAIQLALTIARKANFDAVRIDICLTQDKKLFLSEISVITGDGFDTLNPQIKQIYDAHFDSLRDKHQANID